MYRVILLLALACVLAGCATTSQQDVVEVDAACEPPTPAPPAQRCTRAGPNNILFEFCSSHIKPEGAAEAAKVLADMQYYPGDTLLIEAHASTNEPDAYELGIARAENIRRYMIANGIDGGRISIISHGASQPAVPNDTELNMRLNRRGVFKITPGAAPEESDLDDVSMRAATHENEQPPACHVVRLAPDPIAFEYNSSALDREGLEKIDVLIRELRNFPGDIVLIEGHVSADETADYKLASARADVIRDYMIENGIDGSRITTVGDWERLGAATSDGRGNGAPGSVAVFKVIDGDGVLVSAAPVKVSFPAVYFKQDSASLDTTGFATVGKIVSDLKAYPQDELVVLGHASRDEEQPHELGTERAERVKNYVVSQGVAPARVHAASFGAELPVADGPLDEPGARSRRVEFQYVVNEE